MNPSCNNDGQFNNWNKMDHVCVCMCIQIFLPPLLCLTNGGQKQMKNSVKWCQMTY